MRICVAGTGYVGLVSGVCLADKGHEVICVDMAQEKVDRINAGVLPIHEKGLDALLKRNLEGRLRATTDLRRAVLDTDLSLVAVGTPFDGTNIDLSYIRTVARQIGEALREKDGYHAVVVKSTVVPGTTDEVVLPILEETSGKKAGEDFGVGMNPEFLREGEAVEDFMHPDRIVLGAIDARSLAALEELYKPFSETDILKTNTKTAEMIKYTANSLLATMISFSNEIGNLCAALGDIDVVEVMHGVHLDKRLSPILPDGHRITPAFTTYVEAGCGFGGSCFPKDVKALVAHGKKLGVPMSLLDAVIRINFDQPGKVMELLKGRFPNVCGTKIAVLGLAFKPGTDDMRESPAIPIVQGLLKEGASVRAYDLVARQEARKIFGDAGITYPDSVEQSLDGAQAVLLLTRWEEFRTLPRILSGLEHQPLVIDGRRMLDKSAVRDYLGIGMSAP